MKNARRAESTGARTPWKHAGARSSQILSRRSKTRVIEQVEKFPPELKLFPLAHQKVAAIRRNSPEPPERRIFFAPFAELIERPPQFRRGTTLGARLVRRPAREFLDRTNFGLLV